MAWIRKLAGYGALACLLGGLNVLVLMETVFIAGVYVPLVLGAVLGLVWGVLYFGSSVGTNRSLALATINSVVGTLVFLAICIILYAFVRRWDTSWDLTREGRRTLAPQTRQVLESLETDVEIICLFVHSGDDRVDVVQDKTERFLARCQRYTTRLHVEYIDPQRSPERVEALKVLRVSPVGTIVFRCGTRQREIPLSDVTSRLEERDFTNALVNVIRESRPKVYFLTGHGERDIDDMDAKKGGSDFRLWLEKEAYDVDRCLISVIDPVVPEDCSILIINGYQNDLHAHEVKALDSYFDNGGRMLILVDPQAILPSALVQVEQMRPWLSRRFGIEMGTDIIASPATDGYKVMLIPDFNVLGRYGGMVARSPVFRGSFNQGHVITRSLDKQMVLSVVRTVALSDVQPEGAQGVVLLRSTPDTWAETDLEAVIEKRTVGPDDDETKGPNSLAVAATVRTSVQVGDGSRMRDGRIVVVGDADLASNEGIDFAGHHNFLLNAVAWLSEKEELIAIRPTGKEDLPIVLSPAAQRTVAWIASLGTAQAIALGGVLMFMHRRRIH